MGDLLIAGEKRGRRVGVPWRNSRSHRPSGVLNPNPSSEEKGL
jgi:hypothetical protein